MPRRSLLALFLPAALSFSPGVPDSSTRSSAELISANDNRRAGGIPRDGVLRLRLDTRLGMWHPDGDGAPGMQVPAFAEAGRALQIPGPMIRVAAGTDVEVTVTNSVAGSVLTVHGLTPRPSASRDSVLVPAGETRVVRFRLSSPGTFYYWGTTTGRSFIGRTREDAQLSGAIVVDESADRVNDRVMVIGVFSDTAGFAGRPRNAEEQFLLVVNGRTWPHTERFSYTVGDTVRWRVINASADVHPMHLHGFYFRVDARGNGIVDSSYAELQRDRVVTEFMQPGRTFAMSWVPEKPGNWLFHCHFTSHFEARGALGRPRGRVALASAAHSTGSYAHVANHALEGMSGLVMGVNVRARRGVAPLSTETAQRRMRLLVRPSTGGSAALPHFSFALHERGVEPPLDSGVKAGPPILLERGVPVAITVVNRLAEPTAVHWHGIELDSYFDGVAGFSGSPSRLSPAIAPRDSFVARFTPPRAGTFIYHTHVDELRQQPAGLSGALIILPPGQRYDPATDIPILVTTPRKPDDEGRAVLINGSMAPDTIALRAGVAHRFRFINITTSRPGLRMELRRDTTVLSWKQLAKDGAELPASRQTVIGARQTVSIGETIDVEIAPATPGVLRLEARTSAGGLLAVVPLRVQ